MDQRLQILCNKFLDQRYYFEYDVCSEEKKVFDIFLQEKHHRRYPFGILQYNCEKEIIKSFSLTDEESFDIVRDWVILNTNQMVEELQEKYEEPVVLISMLYTDGVNPHRVTDMVWGQYLDKKKKELIDNYKKLGIFAYYNYKAANGFVD